MICSSSSSSSGSSCTMYSSANIYIYPQPASAAAGLVASNKTRGRRLRPQLQQWPQPRVEVSVVASVGPVPQTSVPIRFRVLQFEDWFDSGSYLISRPRFRVGSGRVNGSSICICGNTIFNFLGDLSVKNIRPVPYVKRI